MLIYLYYRSSSAVFFFAGKKSNHVKESTVLMERVTTLKMEHTTAAAQRVIMENIVKKVMKGSPPPTRQKGLPLRELNFFFFGAKQKRFTNEKLNYFMNKTQLCNPLYKQNKGSLYGRHICLPRPQCALTSIIKRTFEARANSVQPP